MPSNTSTKKTVRKAVAKKTASAPVFQKIGFKKFLTKRNVYIGVVTVAVLIGVLLYVFRGLFIAATVNGQVISRLELTQELDKKAGKQTLDSLVTRDLILQEMKKNNISVTDAEVNAEMSNIESALSKQGRTLNDALLQQGLTKADLIDQLRIQKMIEKLFAKDITVSSKEVDTYLTQNKDSLPAGQDQATLRTSAETQIKQQKLTTKFQTWLANLQKNAKIQYFVSF
ncbi:MAG: SurA N-terminal domain-containing protein [Candidatus Levyibacteriota bacterium]